MDLRFSADELTVLEELQVFGGNNPPEPQKACSNEATGCGSGIPQSGCTNYASYCACPPTD